MAVSVNRGLPWAGGRVVSQARATELGNAGIRVFSAKGLSAPGTLGTFPLPQIGTPIPGTVLVYVRPRLSQDDLGGAGGSPFFGYRWPGTGQGPRVGIAASTTAVHRTNPEYAFYRERRRSPSIGAAAAGSVGRTMDVPFQSEVPWFSHSAS